MVAGFEPIIHLLSESFTSAILVQTLAERWWDTTHTFHIVDRGMTMTPHDFHYMTGLRCDGALINLEGELGTQFGIDLLGRRYTTETICYFDIEFGIDFLGRRAFLLYLLGAYLCINGWQMVSLRWLALFRNFRGAREANWGQACLAYLYSSLDTLSRGTLRQLVGPWKLLEVSSLFSSFVALVLLILAIIFTHMLLRFKGNHTSCPCKLYLCFHLANNHLANYIHSACKLTSYKLISCKLNTIHSQSNLQRRLSSMEG